VMMRITCLLFLPILTCNKKEKLNELISAIHEKDELLDSQEDFLIKENKTHVKTKNAKVEKSNICDDSITNLRNDNSSLIAKIDKLNASLASLKNENEKLIAKAKKLDVCNVSISNLRDENAILHAKIVELKDCKPSTSTIEHISICTKCRDVNIDAIHDHLTMIKQQNDHIAKLDAKIA
jgi:chromosome segregation ATPase